MTDTNQQEREAIDFTLSELKAYLKHRDVSKLLYSVGRIVAVIERLPAVLIEKSAQVPVGYRYIKLASLEERSFPEDGADDDTGQYFCECSNCQRTFVGYKRRNICRVCSVQQEKLICPRCNVDSEGLPCPDNSLNCPISGVASAPQPPQPADELTTLLVENDALRMENIALRNGIANAMVVPTDELAKLRAENAALLKVVDAAINLKNVRGRHNSEIAMNKLMDAIAEQKGK